MCNEFCFVFSSSVFHSLYWSIFGYFYYFLCWFYIPSLKAALLFFIIVSIRFTVSMSSFNCKEDTILRFPVSLSYIDRKLDTISRFPVFVSYFERKVDTILRFLVSLSSFDRKLDTISRFPVFVSYFERKVDTISRFLISVSSFTHEKFLSLNKKTNSCMNSSHHCALIILFHRAV